MNPKSLPTTLGQKRKLYNECVSKGIPIKSSDIEGNDLKKLMAIDIACRDRDVQFVLNALMEDDLLYVSRVIKQSTWLITDVEHASIINPEYLNVNLFPKMTSKAITKLKKHIMFHLKDETRVEAFYNDERDITRRLKWLPNCSLPFIEQKVRKHASKIDANLFKRLCEKSTTIFEIAMNTKNSNRKEQMQATLFVLYKNVDIYLAAIENTEETYLLPDLGAKGTHAIMKHNSEKIINNIHKFITCINIPIFTKYLKKENIKVVLYRLVDWGNDCHGYKFQIRNVISDSVKHFVVCMPNEERYTFVKAVFIDKVHQNQTDEISYDDVEIKQMAKLYKISNSYNDYIWLQFAPFEEALNKMKLLIRHSVNIDIRYDMLNILIDCADSEPLHLQKLLKYFQEQHSKDMFQYKYKFISKILLQKETRKFDKNTWKMLDNIFETIGVYDDSDHDVQKCVEYIIVYKVIQNEKVPNALENKFVFNTLKIYEKYLSQGGKNKLIHYLLNFLSSKLQTTIASQTDLQANVDLLCNFLKTLKDWGKELLDYPWVLITIREYINIGKENSWKINLSNLYNINKSWRKHMFEESLCLNPCEEVCLNALKHDPDLLIRYQSEVEAMLGNDKISLKRLLNKLRIFWPSTLAKDWTNKYLSKLDETDNHKALVKGLFTVLSENQLLDTIQKYKPTESKIDWSQIDGTLISLQRNIAKSMHVGRPQPSPDAILSYAHGDYVQYALPSLLSIFYNLSVIKSRPFLVKLLNSPVSLQKHGLRLAVTKLNPDEIKIHFRNVWNATKNATIRSIVFQFTYDLLCKEEDFNKIKEFWDLLATFIDTLSKNEDKNIYDLLGKIDQVPIGVRADYALKSYTFLNRLLAEAGAEHEKYELLMSNIIENAKDIIVDKYPDFIEGILTEFMPHFETDEQSKKSHTFIIVMSVYLLNTGNEEIQQQRCAKILAPFLKSSFNAWAIVASKRNFELLTHYLRIHMEKYIIVKKATVPYKMFLYIQTEMERELTVPENYTLLTSWKLTTALTKLLHNVHEQNDWTTMCSSVAPEFGKMCRNYLREDVDKHFTIIYELYSGALKKVMDDIIVNKEDKETIKRLICMSMLSDHNFIQAYLAVLNTCCRYDKNNALAKYISEHSSIEIKMHYYSYFENIYVDS